jgi:Arylsulfotransferase (ASST)
VKLTTEPKLKPSFKRYVSDYVSRCTPGKPLSFDVEASDGDRVAVGGKPARSGDFTAGVSRRVGDQVSVRVIADGRTTTHHVRCLPEDFPPYSVKRYRKPQAGFYVLTPIGPKTHGYVAIFDTRGVPVWWSYRGDYGPWDGKVLPNGNVLWGRQYNDRFGLRPEEAAEEHRLDGSLVRTLRTVGSPTDMHDAVLEPNGNYLLDTYRRRCCVDLRKYDGPKNATVYDGEIQELAPDGKLLWRWNSRGHFKLSETTWWPHINKGEENTPPPNRAYDLVHVNSMEPDGDGIVVSARFIDAVFRIDKQTGKIDWKLGGVHTKQSLKIENDPLGDNPLSGNHDARVYPGHSVTVHDNGTRDHRPPRALRYRIDTKKRTAKLLEDIEPELPFSGWGGSVRKLPQGNWVVYWGGNSRMSEIEPDHKKVLDLFFHDRHWSYRAIPVPRGQLTASALRRGMNALARTGAAAPAR